MLRSAEAIILLDWLLKMRGAVEEKLRHIRRLGIGVAPHKVLKNDKKLTK
jgi:hypothetical protein